MKNIEEYGVWFLPEKPEKQLYGKLTFSINVLIFEVSWGSNPENI